MPNPDPLKTQSYREPLATSSEHYVEETIAGIDDKLLETDASLSAGLQKTLNAQGTETSLRPNIRGDLQVDTDQVARRRVLYQDSSGSRSNQVDYQVLKLLGEGGMGQVHLARQTGLGRNVAVKKLLPQTQPFADYQEFLAEAVVTGKLEHPNIVPIYEVGRTESGELFYSMKNVQGRAWSDSMSEMSLSDNLEALINVCDAVAFAHSQGVIHRDLKPANIMIGGFGEVLVMDWGLAMIFGEQSDEVVHVAGTPAYMSPEMVNSPAKSDARSDVYLLGGILFRILSGHAPHAGLSGRDCLIAASRNEIKVCPPEQQKTLDPSGELLEIALRAMKAEPEKRFDSVQAFQQSLREFLLHRDSLELSARADQSLCKARNSGEYSEFSHAVFGFQEALKLWDGNEEARSGTDAARLEWAECAERQGDYDLCLSLLDEARTESSAFRNRVQEAKSERESRHTRLRRMKIFGIAASLLITILTIGAAIWINSERNKAVIAQQQEASERKRADEAAALAKDESKRADQEAIAAKQEAKRADSEADAAKRSQKQAEENLLVAERNAYSADMLLAHSAWERVNLLRMSSLLDRYKDRDDLKGAGWHYFNRQLDPSLCSTTIGNANHENLAVSSDGKFIGATRRHGRLVVLDSVSLDTIHDVPVKRGIMYSLCFSPDGKYLAFGTEDGSVFLFDVGTGKVARHWLAHKGTVHAIQFTSDSRKLLTGGDDSVLKTWETDSGKELQVSKGHDSPILKIDLSPDEKQVVVGLQDGSVKIQNRDDGKIVRRFSGVESEVRALAWHPSLPYVAAGGKGATLFVWNIETGELKFPPIDDSFYIDSVSFSPDGRYLAFGGYEDLVRVLDFESGQEVQSFRGHLYSVRELRFDSAGRRLVSISGDKQIMVWDWQTPSDRMILPGHDGVVNQIVLTPDQEHLVTSGHDGVIVVRDFETAQIVARWKAPSRSILGIVCTPSGKILSAGTDRVLRVWDLTGKLIQSTTLPDRCVYGLSLLPDEQRVLLANVKGVAKVIDVNSGEVLQTFKTDEESGYRLAITPDGKQFISGHERALLRRWDLSSGELLAEYDGNDTVGKILTITVSDDQRYIAAGGMDSTVRVWDLESGKLQHTLRGQSLAVRSIAFSSTSTSLASASMDGTVKLWDLRTGRESFVFPTLTEPWSILVHPDDRRFIAGDKLGMMHFLDTRSWTPEQRIKNRARNVLRYWRERSESLEEMLSAIASDSTVDSEVKQQANQWAEVFWDGQTFDLALSLQDTNLDANWKQALDDADRLRELATGNVLNLEQATRTYLNCLPKMHVRDRDETIRHAKECLMRALQFATFNEYLSLIRSDLYVFFGNDHDVLLARLKAAERLRDESPDEAERIRYFAFCHDALGRFHRRANEHEQAAQQYEQAAKLHLQRIPLDPNAYLPYAGFTLCKNYVGLSYLEIGHYDEAIATYQELISTCDEVIEKGIAVSKIKTRRDTYVENLKSAEFRKKITGDLESLDELISERPAVLVDRAAEFVKSNQYEKVMVAMDRFLELDFDDEIDQLIRAGEVYEESAEKISISNQADAPSDTATTPEDFFQLAERCFRKAADLGWKCDDNARNKPHLSALLERDGVAESIGLNLEVAASHRSQWRTAQEWIDDSDRTNHSNFEQQSNGDWVESGVDFNGESFNTRFEFHRKTRYFVELDKDGVNIRVRLWPDKAFWGRVSSETGEVNDWNFLQVGSWVSPEK